MTIVPDGTQARDFTYIADVVRANLLAAESPHVGKGEAINIGTSKTYSINDVARMIGGPTVWIEPRIEPRTTLADITKAKALLNWQPAIDFKQGIEELKKMYGIV